MSFFNPKVGYSQCCSAGNPTLFGEETSLNKKELHIRTTYKYSYSDTYYSHSRKTPVNFIDNAYFNFFNLQLLYGVTYRLSVQSNMGYFLNKTEEYSNPDWLPNEGFGLGDASLKLNYLIYKSFTRNYTIITSLGLKIPVGVFDQEANHIKLPITVQPSSGSYKYLLNVILNKELKDPRWNIRMLTSFEYAQWIDSKNFNYKYGNLYLLSLLSSYKLNNKLNLGIELCSENRGRSKRENEQVVNSSGYNILLAIPRFSYSPIRRGLISVSADIPVYQNFNGIQLGNKLAITASLSYKIYSL